jgi:hypothetical protein
VGRVPVTRLERALALSVECWPDGRYLVEGGSLPHVVSESGSCDCYDARIRGPDCKHVLAIRLQRGDEPLLRELASLVERLRVELRSGRRRDAA